MTLDFGQTARQVGCPSAHNDLTPSHHIGTIARSQSVAHVLLHDEDAQSLGRRLS